MSTSDDPKPADRVPELIRDWSEIAADTIRAELALSIVDANRLGALVVQAITNAYGGMQFYIPQDYARQLSKRDNEMYKTLQRPQPRRAGARERSQRHRGATNPRAVPRV